jgi:VCBS repeat-containing protein
VVSNPTPTAVDDLYQVNEDGLLEIVAPGVLGNDSDPDGDGLFFVQTANQASNGVLEIQEDGSLTYRPAADFSGQELIVYEMRDADGETAAAVLNIKVLAVDDAPLVVNDAYQLDEDKTLTVSLAQGVLANDQAGGDGAPTGGLVATKVSDPANGTLTLNADGSFSYTPNANFNGTDSFTYSITDADGTTRIGTVTLSINAVNDLPVVIGEAIPEAWQETTDDVFLWNLLDAESVELSLGALFSDIEEGALTLVAAGLPEGLLLDPETGVISGSLGTSVSSGGAANDGVYEVTLSVTDSEGATRTITLQIVVSNPTPTAVDDLYQVNEDGLLEIAAPGVLGNDSDPDGDGLFFCSNR